MANGQIRGEDLIQSDVFKVFERLDKVILQEIKRMQELEDATRQALSGGAVGSASGKFGEATKKTNSALTEQEKVLREINRLKERNEQVTRDSLSALQSERTKRTQLNRLLKDEAVLNSKLSDAYTKLRKQRDLAGKELRNLIVSNKASNREIRRAQREFDRLDDRVRKADRAVRNFRDNVGNYGSAIRGVVGLTRQLAAAFGIYSAIQIGKDIFNQVKALDALRFGLEQVTETQSAFNQAQFFLDEVAERAGADILVLTNRYTNFLAAAKTTNLTLARTQQVFENIVVAGSALGRSTDDINGALRALEQILSKGKVQAEELRGQLGERLPGAFQILEKALGLTTGQLNELLEVGGLLSIDAIPALADGLEDAFNLDVIDRVETLVASQTRLSNEWNLFLRDLERGGGIISTTLGALFEGLTSIVVLLREMNGQGVLNAEAEGQVRGLALAIQAAEEEAAKSNITFQEAAERILPRYNQILEEYGVILSDVTNEQSQSAINNTFNMITGRFDEQQRTAERAVKQIHLYNVAIKTLQTIIETGKLPDELDKMNTELEINDDTLKALRIRLQELRKELEITDFKTPKFAELRAEITRVDNQIKLLTGSYKENTKQQKELAEAGTEKFFEDLSKVLDNLIKQTIVGSAEWFEYTRALADVEKQLESLRAEAKLLSGDLSDLGEFIDLEDANLADEIDDFLNNEGLNVILSDFANRFKLNRQEIVDEYIKLYGRDFDKFKEFEENKLKTLQLIEAKKLELRQKTLDLADALSEAFLEIQLGRLDEEQERQEEVFDSVVNNKESSEEAIAQAERDRDASEKRIEQERKKRENQAFLFRQALAIGDIFIADALARANAIASTAAIIPYIPLGAATLATLQALISTNTGLAIATVLAQSLPAFFFKGKNLGDNYQGKGIWGELQREVKVSKDGALEVSPDGPSMTDVKSSDIILESVGAFTRQLGKSNSEVNRRVMRGMKRSNSGKVQVLTADRGHDLSGLEQIVGRAVSKGLSKAKLSPQFIIYNDSKVRRVP